MSIKDIVPKLGGRNKMPERRREVHGMESFQREMNRLFDEFFNDFGLAPSFKDISGKDLAFSPKVNISENDKEVEVSVELPGMEEKDITVELEENSLTVRGERKDENEDKGKDWHRREYSYGSFYRIIDLPAKVEGSKAKAKFKKGILTVNIPKLGDKERNRKKIDITGE